jgi:hypothetical protein
MYAYSSVGPNLDPALDFDLQEMKKFTNVKCTLFILRPPCQTTKLKFSIFRRPFWIYLTDLGFKKKPGLDINQ